jgi:hypothetical protein
MPSPVLTRHCAIPGCRMHACTCACGKGGPGCSPCTWFGVGEWGSHYLHSTLVPPTALVHLRRDAGLRLVGELLMDLEDDGMLNGCHQVLLCRGYVLALMTCTQARKHQAVLQPAIRQLHLHCGFGVKCMRGLGDPGCDGLANARGLAGAAACPALHV